MQENFLHFLWRYRRFNQENLITTQNEPIQILEVGEHNTHAGPDFFNAKVQIGETVWAGNVEMHLQSSEWKTHKHQEDRAYDSVILHVVMEDDDPVFRPNGQQIPCLEIKKYIPLKITSTYQRIWHNAHWIPCQHHYHQVSDFTKQNWLDRILIERLEMKTLAIEQALQITNQDWEEVFYRFLARNFGVKVNTEPFEQLARSVSYKTITKHKNNHLQIEALLFGQAGLLDENFTDEYPKQLQKEYQFLQQKHRLIPIPKERWKFMRMRPANFPSIRIAQFAQLLFQSTHLFSKMLAAQNVKEIHNMLEVKVENYWKTHYVFDKTSISRTKKLGKSTIQLIVINTIVPFLFAYSRTKGDAQFRDRALQFLETLPPEKNSIISKWQELGQTVEDAADTQALIHLKRSYCDKKACTNCAIGNQILK